MRPWKHKASSPKPKRKRIPTPKLPFSIFAQEPSSGPGPKKTPPSSLPANRSWVPPLTTPETPSNPRNPTQQNARSPPVPGPGSGHLHQIQGPRSNGLTQSPVNRTSKHVNPSVFAPPRADTNSRPSRPLGCPSGSKTPGPMSARASQGSAPRGALRETEKGKRSRERRWGVVHRLQVDASGVLGRWTLTLLMRAEGRCWAGIAITLLPCYSIRGVAPTDLGLMLWTTETPEMLLV